MSDVASTEALDIVLRKKEKCYNCKEDVWNYPMAGGLGKVHKVCACPRCPHCHKIVRRQYQFDGPSPEPMHATNGDAVLSMRQIYGSCCMMVVGVDDDNNEIFDHACLRGPFAWSEKALKDIDEATKRTTDNEIEDSENEEYEEEVYVGCKRSREESPDLQCYERMQKH